MAALCVPGNSELVPAAVVGLDSLLASSTSIIQAFPTSYLYRVSPSISPFGRCTGNQTNFGPFTPESSLPRIRRELAGMEPPCSVDILLGRGKGKAETACHEKRRGRGMLESVTGAMGLS